MREECLKDLFRELEESYRDLRSRGAKLIDIDMVINDLQRYRL